MTDETFAQSGPTRNPSNELDALAQHEKDLARAAATRFATAELTLPELLVESERWEQHRAVLETFPREGPGGDLAAEGIAYADHRINVITDIMRRMLAVGAGASSRSSLEPDFAKARYADLVGLASMLGYETFKAGRDKWTMRCPWHGGGMEQTPSLVLYPPGQGWHCFGCGRGGRDAASFAAEHFCCSQLEGLRWVEQLADGAGQ